jgi:hypothetical protein
VVKGNLTVFGSVGISIAAVGGCTELLMAIQRIANLNKARAGLTIFFQYL